MDNHDIISLMVRDTITLTSRKEIRQLIQMNNEWFLCVDRKGWGLGQCSKQSSNASGQTSFLVWIHSYENLKIITVKLFNKISVYAVCISLKKNKTCKKKICCRTLWMWWHATTEGNGGKGGRRGGDGGGGERGMGCCWLAGGTVGCCCWVKKRHGWGWVGDYGVHEEVSGNTESAEHGRLQSKWCFYLKWRPDHSGRMYIQPECNSD